MRLNVLDFFIEINFGKFLIESSVSLTNSRFVLRFFIFTFDIFLGLLLLLLSSSDSSSSLAIGTITSDTRHGIVDLFTIVEVRSVLLSSLFVEFIVVLLTTTRCVVFVV